MAEVSDDRILVAGPDVQMVLDPTSAAWLESVMRVVFDNLWSAIVKRGKTEELTIVVCRGENIQTLDQSLRHRCHQQRWHWPANHWPVVSVMNGGRHQQGSHRCRKLTTSGTLKFSFILISDDKTKKLFDSRRNSTLNFYSSQQDTIFFNRKHVHRRQNFHTLLYVCTH